MQIDALYAALSNLKDHYAVTKTAFQSAQVREKEGERGVKGEIERQRGRERERYRDRERERDTDTDTERERRRLRRKEREGERDGRRERASLLLPSLFPIWSSCIYTYFILFIFLFSSPSFYLILSSCRFRRNSLRNK